jgi:hypothetical protein
MGGLGNQLFQIFFLISYSFRYKLAFKLPYAEKNINGCTERATYWTNLLKSLTPFTIKNVPLPLKDIMDTKYIHIPEEDNVMFRGYFQSHKYFEDQFENVCKIIKLNDSLNDVNTQYMSNTKYLDVDVSVHFRWGDYKQLTDYHPILPMTYYRDALLYVNEKREIKKILCFCEKEDMVNIMNCIKYTLDETPELKNIIVEMVENNIPDYKQMLMMSLCKHNIIANSTFSWWGAYFNKNTDKIVCYPETWFGPLNKSDVTDLFPESWKMIKCNSEHKINNFQMSMLR